MKDIKKKIVQFVVVAAFFSCHPVVSAQSALIISSVSDNRSSYANSQVPTYEKLEITSQISNIQATNLQFPYLNSSQADTYLSRYVDMGISVDGLFLPPGETD